MVDDYGYAGIDFHNDPDLVLLEGEDWDATLGKKHVISFSYSDYFLIYFVILSFFFWVYGITDILFCRSGADTTSGDVPDIMQGCTKDRSGPKQHDQE